MEPYDLHGVFHAAVGPEFTLDVFITNDSLLLWEIFPMRAQQASVEWDGWE